MDIFIIGILWAAATFFLFGVIVGIGISFLNRFNFSFIGNLWFYFLTGLSYIAYLGVRIIPLAGLLGLILEGLLGISRSAVILVYLGCTINLLTYFFAKWYITGKEIPSTVISFIPVVLLVIFRESFSLKIITSLGAVWLSLVISISFLAALIRTFFRKKTTGQKSQIKPNNSLKPEVNQVNKKVAFIGLDGCDWQLLKRFIDQGKLLTFRRLIDGGASARLKTIQPTLSPLIWNSILTGKSPSDHGIAHWYKTKFPLLPPVVGDIVHPRYCRSKRIILWLIKKNLIRRIPFSTEDRGVKAIWNILSDYDKSSINVGWIFSWPAEKIRGVQVSWLFYPFEEAAQGFKRFSSSKLPQRVYPESLFADLERFIVRPSDLADAELRSMHFTTESINPEKLYVDKLSPWDYTKDKTFLQVSSYLLDQNKEFDFFSLYLYGIDAVCHNYWPFSKDASNNQKHKNELLSVSDSEKFKKEAESFDKCILRYYEYLDSEIAKLLSKLGQDCNIVIASDHGFNLDGSEHENAPDAVLIAYGPYIAKGKNLSSLSIYDVLPTVLCLLGLPLANDMPGRVAKELFSDQFLNAFPFNYIDSYEHTSDKLNDRSFKLDEASRKGIEERLRSLGYID
ncbi:MAG: alkaline phosphatase family protein [Candidatus Omnitrophica bacterium]|nr:alkaline phosphatase family protein [Candidatus Omnitrophota bacterium]